MKHKISPFIFISHFLPLAFLCILISGCGGMSIKRINTNNPNDLESNERVVFGRVLFIAHSEEIGDVSFPPCGLGLFHMETESRAERASILPKPWFENDGTFFWILPIGSYRIDALGWGFVRDAFASVPDPDKPRKNQAILLGLTLCLSAVLWSARM